MIPVFRNDGTPVPPVELDAVKQSLWLQFGGCTVRGPFEGHWYDDAGNHFEDRVLEVSVVCPNDRLDEVRDAVIAIGRRLGQLAMYFEVRDYDGVQFLDC